MKSFEDERDAAVEKLLDEHSAELDLLHQSAEAEKEENERTVAQLRDDVEALEDDLEVERNSSTSLRAKVAELTTTVSDLSANSEATIEELTAECDELVAQLSHCKVQMVELEASKDQVPKHQRLPMTPKKRGSAGA